MPALPSRNLPPAGQVPQGTNRRFATFRAVSALILREMATRYGKSPGGYVWALLEPLGAIVILSVGFAVVMRTPPLGNSFILFYATGFLPFNLYLSISAMIAGSIPFSRSLLQYPAVTWVDAVLARFVLNALTGILVMILLLTAIVATVDTRLVLNLEAILIAVALSLLLGGGVGILNSAVMGLFPVWRQFWNIMTRPLFLISGVIFLYEDMPPIAQDILWYNPLMHITGLARAGFYPTYPANYVDLPFVITCGLVPLFLGIVLMGRFHRDILQG